MHRALVLPLLLLTALLAPLAAAENTTNTTNTTTTTTVAVNVSIVNVSIPYVPGLYLNAWPTASGIHIRIVVSNMSSVSIPLRLVAGWGNETYINTSVSKLRCSPPICYADYTINASRAWVALYANGSLVYNISIVYPSSYQSPIGNLAVMVTAALALTLVVRSNPLDAGLGAIAAGVVIYLLSLAGLAEPNPVVIAILIIGGAIILWVARR